MSWLEWMVVAAVLGLLFWQLVLPNIKSRGGGAAPAAPPGASWRWMDYAKYAWPVLLVIVAIVIAVLGGLFEAKPSAWTFAGAHKYVWGHGPGLLALTAVAAIAVAVYGGKARATLFQVLGWTVLALFVGFWIMSWFEPTTTTAKTSQTVVNPMMLTLGPGEKSKKIPVPYQMRVVMDGKDFRYHCVYGNGDDVSFLPGQPPCPSGDMPYVYAENLRKGDNVITYSYAK